MAAPQRIIASEVASRPGRPIRISQASGWSILQPAGVLFLLVGTFDVVNSWYPFAFGSPEWEFGTVTTTLNALPGPVIGLTLLAASALSLQQVRLARALSAALALLALLVVAAVILWLTTVPIALRSVPVDSLPHVGLKKAILKTASQAIFYPTVLFWMAFVTWRRTKETLPDS